MRAWIVPILLALSMPAVAQHGHHHSPEQRAPAAAVTADPGYAKFKREMDLGMDKMMKEMHAPGYSGDPDVDFLAMMIPHHEGAIEMARLQLIHGQDPATRRLAEDIIASQQVEIAGMKRRLAMLLAKDPSKEASYPELGGARGPAK